MIFARIALAHVRSLLRDARGNVLLLFGLALVPLTFATGMGIDYSQAMRLQTKLNAAADAAALAAVSGSTMRQSSATACTLARNMFVQQAANQAGLILDTSNAAQLIITIKDSTSATASTTSTCASGSTATTASYSRTATVRYVGKSQNTFAGILGMATLTVQGTSQANSAVAPNIDFYVALDTSPSMAIAATQSGIDTMVANTSAQQNGCAFACHQTQPNTGDNAGNPINPSTGRPIDNYALARRLNVVLRTDLVTRAAANLMDVAATTSQTNGASYRMSVSTFDTAFRTVQSMTSDLAAAKTAAAATTMQVVCQENQLVCGTYNFDMNTNFTAMQNGLSGILTPPGNGTRLAGDRPQGVIFIVTDGVRDEALGNSRWIGQLERPNTSDPDICENAKAGGYRIAILYTSYFPLPTNSFYNSFVDPFQSQISPNLKACASPGLFYEVSTGGDISTALAQLFQSAVATAHLTK